jgi:cytidylate kinase
VTSTDLVLIGGRAGVGKTTVAFEMHAKLGADCVQHAVIEGDNLDMAYPTAWEQGHDLAEANLTAIWQNYQRLGYRRLIYTNTARAVSLRGGMDITMVSAHAAVKDPRLSRAAD